VARLGWFTFAVGLFSALLIWVSYTTF